MAEYVFRNNQGTELHRFWAETHEEAQNQFKEWYASAYPTYPSPVFPAILGNIITISRPYDAHLDQGQFEAWPRRVGNLTMLPEDDDDNP